MAKLKGILLTEGMHGMVSQVEGLAKALDIDFTHHRVELNHFWKLIPPNLSPVSQIVFKKINHDDFDVIISCGRKSVIPSIHLKNTTNKKVFNIHIQDPKVNLNHFDFIVAPEHDAIEGQNVISTKGAIHYLTESEINENKDYLNSFIKKDERKIWALIMGGPTKYYEYSRENIKAIFENLNNLNKQNNFQLVVIPSMRTPKNIIQYAKDYFGESHTVIGTIDKKAYLSALAISEKIVVTCDSSSMISEAALTGKPIYVANISPKKNDKRFQRFRNLFKELNITRILGEEIEKAMMDKKPYADYIVTQWLLESQPIVDFISKQSVPVHVGITGPMKITSLIKFANIVGAKNSINFLKSNFSKALDLLKPKDPNELIGKVKEFTGNFHIYTFGGLKETNKWLKENGYV
ncbi:mitochondrial fission ELM1 family protein [Candidatus Pelagibacter sp.]|nr:mitochondrial fission ELM1 family protein [Candidatus Pelagibacter sp.]